MSTQALILIDFQNDYFNQGKWPLDNINQAAANAKQVLLKHRAENSLIIHVRHEFLNDDAPFFIAGSEGANIHQTLAPIDGEITVLKHQVNSFHETNLKQILDDHNITQLTIIGAMTHMCIDAATRAAADFGYAVTLIEDACAAKALEHNGHEVSAKDVHHAYLSALGFAYANITATAQYIS